MNIFSVIGIVLAILKLVGVIAISWWTVIAVFCVPFMFAVAVTIIVGIINFFNGLW